MRTRLMFTADAIGDATVRRARTSPPAALVSPHIVEQVVRWLEDGTSRLDLAGCPVALADGGTRCAVVRAD